MTLFLLDFPIAALGDLAWVDFHILDSHLEAFILDEMQDVPHDARRHELRHQHDDGTVNPPVSHGSLFHFDDELGDLSGVYIPLQTVIDEHSTERMFSHGLPISMLDTDGVFHNYSKICRLPMFGLGQRPG